MQKKTQAVKKRHKVDSKGNKLCKKKTQAVKKDTGYKSKGNKSKGTKVGCEGYERRGIKDKR